MTVILVMVVATMHGGDSDGHDCDCIGGDETGGDGSNNVCEFGGHNNDRGDDGANYGGDGGGDD